MHDRQAEAVNASSCDDIQVIHQVCMVADDTGVLSERAYVLLTLSCL